MTASKERPYGEKSLFCILMGELGWGQAGQHPDG